MRGRKGEPQWPKTLPVLTEEQQQISEDWYRVWLPELARKYKPIDWFHHTYPTRRPAPPGGRTLEIGSGFGNQIQYEDLTDQEYVAVDLRPEMTEAVTRDYPEVTALTVDVQREMPFPDGHFDRVLAVQVLEHMPNLPPALDEIHRVMRPNAKFIVVIPCEGGRAYSLARQISSKPQFEKRYDTDFDWFVASEHCNVPWEIEYELRKRFRVAGRTFFPLLVPSVNANLLIGLTLTRD
jgi:SAM-dependent methyltransferase